MIEKGILGNAIRSARIKMNLTQEEVAELIDISPTHYKHLESEHRMPSIEVLFKLCDVLSLSLDSLLFVSTKERPLLQDINNYAHKCTDKQLQIVLAAMQVMIAQNFTDK